MKRSTKLTTAVAGVAVTGALGIALAGPALAEPAPSGSASPSPSASAQPGTPGGSTADRDAFRQQRQDELAAALATELGIDKAKVAAALEKVRAGQQEKIKAERTAQLKTRLDEAVAAGTLTADQAAAILKAAEAGVLQGGFGGGPGGGHGRGGFFGR